MEVANGVALWRLSRDLVNGLRETFGLIGVPIRLSMRPGSDNPYARKKRRG
jgi:GTPase